MSTFERRRLVSIANRRQKAARITAELQLLADKTAALQDAWITAQLDFERAHSARAAAHDKTMSSLRSDRERLQRKLADVNREMDDRYREAHAV